MKPKKRIDTVDWFSCDEIRILQKKWKGFPLDSLIDQKNYKRCSY